MHAQVPQVHLPSLTFQSVCGCVKGAGVPFPQKKHGRILTVKLGAKYKSGSYDIVFDRDVNGCRRGVPIPIVEVLAFWAKGYIKAYSQKTS